jgi:GNAT superfamily N-acetyltransferase
MNVNFSLLGEDSAVSSFDCGDEDLNLFLKNLAWLFQRRHFGITICAKIDNVIVGYYTLCPACIQRDELPAKALTGPRPNPIPAFRICRLAVDKNFQGMGCGKLLLVHALKKCVGHARTIGGSLILIDAKHAEAKNFYERFGFISSQSHPLLLIQTIKFIEKHLLSP